MKLKTLLLESLSMTDLVAFLRHFKSGTPMADTNEISDAIVSFLHSKMGISESIKSTLVKIILSALLTVYSSQTANDVIRLVMKKMQQPQHAKPDNKQIIDWVNKYSKVYGVDRTYLMRLLDEETDFTAGSRNFNPFQVGDKNNTLGPSYGIAQIKLPTAKEIYSKKPESDVDTSSITPARLQYDVQFNIRTSAKLLAYYYRQFKDTVDAKERMALAATAYNAGLPSTLESGEANDYGKYIAGLM